MIPGKQIGPGQVVSAILRRKWLVILPFVVISIATAMIAARMPNRYRSETLILVVPQRVPESYVKSTVTARIEDRLQSIQQQILSRTRLERIIQDFGLYPAERRTGIMEDVVEAMRRSIEVQVVKGDAFRVSYTGDEPRTVMKVTERLASLFIEENLRDRAVLAEDSYEFLEAQLGDARKNLLEHEKKLEEYRRKFNGELPTQLDSNLQLIQNTQMQIQSLNESMARDRDRRLVIERLLADASVSDAPAPVAAPPVGVPGTDVQQLEAARQALKQMELRLTPEHPDILRTARLIARLEASVAAESAAAGSLTSAAPVETQADAAKRNRMKEARSELEQLDRQLAKKDNDEKQLHALIERYQARVESAPTRESELIELTRDYDTLQKTYTSLLMKKEDSKLAASLERRQIGEQFKMLDPARMSEKPFSPDRMRIDVLGALAGLGIGLGLVALLELNDTTIKTDDEIVQALALPVLALIPMMESEGDQRRSVRRRLLMAVSSGALLVVAAALMVWKLRA